MEGKGIWGPHRGNEDGALADAGRSPGVGRELVKSQEWRRQGVRLGRGLHPQSREFKGLWPRGLIVGKSLEEWQFSKGRGGGGSL